VGKSQIVAQLAEDLEIQFLDVRAVQLDPVDLRGLPRIASDRTEWVPPKFLPSEGKGILFLDELTAAPQMTQAGCYLLVLDRRLSDYALPERWVDGRIGGVLWETVLANLSDELGKMLESTVEESRPDTDSIKAAILHEEQVPGAELRRG
jgi:hypothetical protein